MARVAMLERGSVEAAVLSDPAMTLFLRRHPNTPLFADVRGNSGVRQVYGTDSYVSAVLISRAEWLRANPDIARRLGRAVNHTLGWIQTHSLKEITQETPDQLRGTDPSLFAEALGAALPSFPADAKFEPAGVQAVMKVLESSYSAGDIRKVDWTKTYTNEFAAGK